MPTPSSHRTDFAALLSRQLLKTFATSMLIGVAILFLAERARCATDANANGAPNVVLIVTDDQGYGDLGAHGNTMIETPQMDRLHSQSVRLTDFHVDPTCAPTRSALMTGRYSTRVGVWHTVMGRSQLRSDETTMADVFRANGYATGMFGKWHLGDNHPFQPHERGFDEAFYHGGGGVTQQADYWGNDYFDDTYFANGKPVKCEGYCTDVWFDKAIDFIRRKKDGPFFCYLATNAPHSPLFVAEKYWKPYAEKGVPEPMARFYGMITNIDENLGRLRKELKTLGLEENTILIFMTDNGTATGVNPRDPKRGLDEKGRWHGFNDGMRGKKGSHYDGGHRVPCFVHWPKGGLDRPVDIDEITAHVDVLPTLIDALGLEQPDGMKKFDGSSLIPLFRRHMNGEEAAWPDRELFVEVNRHEQPPKWKCNVVMTERWRLTEDRELYDIQADPGQKKNVIDKHPEVAKRLHDAYEARWPGLTERAGEYTRTVLGSEKANPVTLYSHDWHPTAGPISAWNQGQVKQMVPWNGFWAVRVAEAGKYRFTLRHRPEYAAIPLKAKTARFEVGKTPKTLGGLAKMKKPVPEGATEICFEVELPAGDCFVQTWLEETSGTSRGAYYVEVKRLVVAP